ncbi:lipoprotein [Nocardia sp. JMUB6875]
MRAHLLAVAAVALPLAGCEAEDRDERTGSAPHGYVEGAEETATEQPRLVVADKETGAVRVIDAGTGRVTELDAVPGGIERVLGDGRFAYLTGPRATRVVDSGVWTVDHGDHGHHYSAAVREIGDLGHGAVSAVSSDSVVTAVGVDDRTVLLDRAALVAGVLTERQVIDGIAVPYEGQLLGIGDSRDSPVVRSRDGPVITTLPETCSAPRGHAVTRRGVVFGCADGALVISRASGSLAATRIPFPHPVADSERPTEFFFRPGGSTLVAPAGEHGVWTLDIRARAWTFTETGPVAAANAAGSDAPLLVLGRDGLLRAFDLATGAETARVQLLSRPIPERIAPVIRMDANRAYLNDPAGKAVHEIDYRDSLRRTRTFDLDIAPDHLVETGR